jgi:hypothetical protein
MEKKKKEFDPRIDGSRDVGANATSSHPTEIIKTSFPLTLQLFWSSFFQPTTYPLCVWLRISYFYSKKLICSHQAPAGSAFQALLDQAVCL